MFDDPQPMPEFSMLVSNVAGGNSSDLTGQALSEWRARTSQPQVSRSVTGSHDGKVSGVPTLHQKDEYAAHPDRILPGLFIRKDAVTSNFIGRHPFASDASLTVGIEGLNSTGATIAFCVRESLESASATPITNTFDWLIEAGPHVDEAGITNKPEVTVYPLPPKDLAAKCIKGTPVSCIMRTKGWLTLFLSLLCTRPCILSDCLQKRI
jgi:hypothetical protein